MAFVYKDFVKETTTTTGTGTYTLGGAVPGFRTFIDGLLSMFDGDQCYYAVTDGTDWEVGVGTLAEGPPDTLARTTIADSSNSGAAVNWGAGTKVIYCVNPADNIEHLPTLYDYIDTEITSNFATNTIAAGGDITGSFRYARAGNVVTITATGIWTHASATSAQSDTGIIPSALRPTANTNFAINLGALRTANLLITSTGTMTISHYDWTGTGTAETSINPFSVSYAIS